MDHHGIPPLLPPPRVLFRDVEFYYSCGGVRDGKSFSLLAVVQCSVSGCVLLLELLTSLIFRDRGLKDMFSCVLCLRFS